MPLETNCGCSTSYSLPDGFVPGSIQPHTTGEEFSLETDVGELLDRHVSVMVQSTSPESPLT